MSAGDTCVMVLTMQGIAGLPIASLTRNFQSNGEHTVLELPKSVTSRAVALRNG